MEVEDELGFVEAEGGRANHDTAVVVFWAIKDLSHH